MSSEAQVLANRRNAEKSTGPRTAEGKAVVSQNAVTHGLLARPDVVKGEDQEEFERHRDQMLGELVPVGAMETTVAERIVSLSWRLKRAERLQNEVFDYMLAQEIKDTWGKPFESLSPKDENWVKKYPDTDPRLAPGRMVVKDFSNAKVVDRLLMYERRIESSLYKTMAELQKLRLMRKPDPPMEARTMTPGSPGADDRLCKTNPIPRTPAIAELALNPSPAGVDGQLCKTNPISRGKMNADSLGEKGGENGDATERLDEVYVMNVDGQEAGGGSVLIECGRHVADR